MNSYSLWDFEIQELVQDFVEEDLSVKSADAFLNGLGLGTYDVISGPMSAMKMLLVYSNTVYSFTPEDLNWLSAASKVISGFCENELQMYFVEMHCNEDDYYIYCAALVKIFNVVCPGKNVFIFKLDSGFAVGASRSFEKCLSNNFCVSALIKTRDVSKYAEFIDELQYADPNDIPSIIIHYSPQEEANVATKHSKVNRVIDPDYLLFLDEVEAFYGVSAENERKHYLSNVNNSKVATESYKNACLQLSRTATNDDFTSFDELIAAERAEKKAADSIFTEKNTLSEEAGKNPFNENETYLNAEVMLNELLNRGTT